MTQVSVVAPDGGEAPGGDRGRLARFRSLPASAAHPARLSRGG
jgi:hypothetical protein